MAAVELSSRPGAVAERAYDAMLLGYEKGIMLRVTGDTIAMSPPLVLTKAHIDEIVDKLGSVLKELP
jgi:beta-alanine--pyruvate transaminase